jgi:Protein of unknown function (DUF1328)
MLGCATPRPGLLDRWAWHAGAATGIAQILFYVFLVNFLVVLIMNFMALWGGAGGRCHKPTIFGPLGSSPEILGSTNGVPSHWQLRAPKPNQTSLVHTITVADLISNSPTGPAPGRPSETLRTAVRVARRVPSGDDVLLMVAIAVCIMAGIIATVAGFLCFCYWQAR